MSTLGERERPIVPRAEPGSYYGRPVIKDPIWTWEIPTYFFTGGLAGASAGLAWLSELRGNRELARRSWMLALGGIVASPALLISDLGRPARFLNMLRVFKPTSPMSVGSWLLSAAGGAIGVATLNATTGALSRPARVAKPAAALLGLPVSTYTAALVSNTAVPVWHEARRTLPFLFAGGAAAAAGAAAVLATPPEHARPARRLALAGAVGELAAARAMEQSLGEIGEPYHEGTSGTLSRTAQLLTAVGGMTLAGAAGRRRAAAAAGAGAVFAGALIERWAVYKAGFASAADPKYTVGPQRERIRSGETRGAERRATAA
ncbi:MAG TPA: NrfD/PsrC family molybdoenzyme membrane anchor subunit [Thermoleophilaceae bacterium]|nr:NrfD/PsrC family molybdoenzyme membrane anchor subunit [Thermoleophilaceae bacterium]